MVHWVKNPPAMKETQETWVQSLGAEDTLEEGMAIHFNFLAWEIPQTEGPGGLQSIELHRVVHNEATQHAHTLLKISRILM